MSQSKLVDAEHNDTPAKEEGESITSSLPMREGWWTPFFLFQGFWTTMQVVKNITLLQAQFQPRHDDVILCTYPKCGTTWLKALAFTLINRSKHPVTDVGHPLLTQNPQSLVPFLEALSSRVFQPVELEAIPSPRLLCTHLPYTSLPVGSTPSGCRIVYLCREPKDVVVSMWHYFVKIVPDSFIEFHKAFEFFCEGFSFCGPFWEHCLGYWKQSVNDPSSVLFLKYNDMRTDPIKHVKMIAEFLQVPFTIQEENAGIPEEVVRLCSFDNLKGLPINSTGVVRIGGISIETSSFFRSAKVGDWQNYMTKEMAEKLDNIVEEKFRGSNLSF